MNRLDTDVDDDREAPASLTSAESVSGALSEEFGPRRWSSRDGLTVAFLLGLSCVLFAVPALSGHPLLPGDANTQNYPLRVLAGDLLAHGHLPLWNAWNWSGTPLLGGLNAGALFPGTFLFALVAPLLAWVTNEIVTYALCAVGLYLLLRAQRLVPIAAALAAVSFTFAGFMGAHLRHTGLIQGTALVPWVLLALEGLASRQGKLPWWLLLSVSGGLIILTGEPRAISNAVIVAGIYLAAVVIPRAAHRTRVVLWVALAVPVAFALGAVQLLPGLAFLHTSQRAVTDYAFFSRGSLSLSALPLLLVPYLLGAYGTFDFLPTYIGHYNLHELVGYIGLLPLVALATIPFWRPRANTARLWAWVCMVVVGLLFALGGNTPFGHLLSRVPLYSGQRLQSRNLMVVDLGLAGVFAWWIDTVIARPRKPLSRRRDRFELLVSLLPSVFVVTLVVTAWRAGPTLQHWLEARWSSTALVNDLAPYLCGVVLIAVAVGVFVLIYRRLSIRARAGFLAVIVAADVGLVMLNGELGLTDSSTIRHGAPHTVSLATELAHGGRMAVYDPQHRVFSDVDNALTSDRNILYGLPSIQGYSSIVDGQYDTATGTHTRRSILLPVLAGDLADQLDLRLLLVPGSYVGAPSSGERDESLPADPALETALDSSHWVRGARYGPYVAFSNARARGRAWIVPLATAPLETSSVRGAVVQRVTVRDGDHETDVVRSPKRALLVRSVAFSKGWSARVRTNSGVSTTLPVRRFGLVQAVEIPTGPATVEWSYHPPGFELGLFLTLLATIGLTCLGVALAARGIVARRRTRAGSRSGQ